MVSWGNDEEIMTEKELREECHRLRNTVSMLSQNLTKMQQKFDTLLDIAHTLARGNY